MNRKERIALHLERIAESDNNYEVVYFQKRPFTMAWLRYHPTGKVYFAFSKVCWPDRWDSEYGKGLALKKAVADLIKELP